MNLIVIGTASILQLLESIFSAKNMEKAENIFSIRL